MKIKEYTCHMCRQVIFADPKTRLTMIGFNWNPAAFDSPGFLYDLCPECSGAFVKAWNRTKDERQKVVEDLNAKTWVERYGLNAPGSKTARTGNIYAHSLEAARWNYHKKEQQRSWSF